ncbi:hypothetical protein [Novosphingobium sp. Gsoil 351]|uniref:hypothetical protein n=1 Tax=Novosphingobium sp. Gsoil 351 TaxID=2675225 RepID=UPI0012B4E96D|nr:hypothetical protein [Novosphingobium sp. Gsoil 351]QGN53609.1 hypothetical protein GKE62_02670 [Novosphingobium sp. Gsoil 351]
MRTVVALAGFAATALLSACSPSPQADADEKAIRAETPAQAEQAAEKPMPVLDAQGNELDPELADAVREKMEEEKAAQEDSGGDASAPSDDGAAPSNDET